MIVKVLEVGLLGTNCYLVICSDTKQALVIDPGGNAPDIVAAAGREGASIQLIANTHEQFAAQIHCQSAPDKALAHHVLARLARGGLV